MLTFHETVQATFPLLADHAEVRAAVNDPIGPFDGRPVSMAKNNLPLLDVLLKYGADANQVRY